MRSVIIAAVREIARHTPVVLITSAIWLASLAFPAAGDNIKRPTVVITQGHEELGGIKVYINQHALKIEYMVGKCVIVSSAPDWRVVFYNPRNNKGMEMPVDKWLHHKIQMYYLPIPSNKNNWVLVPIAKPRLFGFASTTYLLCRPDFKGRPNLLEAKQRKYQVLNTQLANPVACQILQHTLDVPYTQGVPVSMTFISDDAKGKDAVNGKRYVRTLVMTEAQQQTISDDFFRYPTNFVPTNKEADIMNDPKRDKDVYSYFYP